MNYTKKAVEYINQELQVNVNKDKNIIVLNDYGQFPHCRPNVHPIRLSSFIDM